MYPVRLAHAVALVVSLFIGALLGAPIRAAVPVQAPPSLETRAHILVDFQTGKVLAESNADMPMEPASITKLMTAYVTFKAVKEGRFKLDEPVTISERAWRSEGSRSFVQVGTQIPLEDLLKRGAEVECA